MKTVITSLIAMVLFSSCNNQSKEQKTTTTETAAAEATATLEKAAIQKLVVGYLNLKNALANDNAVEAESAANALMATMTGLDESAFTEKQKKVYDAVKDDARENVEHIAENAKDIDHQREHFEMLSSDMYDLVKEFGSEKPLYKDFCPMYNNKKGAAWLSETKEIKNPYFGKEMLTCGKVQEEIK
jgi:hypothetical protein